MLIAVNYKGWSKVIARASLFIFFASSITKKPLNLKVLLVESGSVSDENWILVYSGFKHYPFVLRCIYPRPILIT